MDPELFDGFDSWIVYEFRANNGRVNRPFNSRNLVILTTRRAGSHRHRSVPVVAHPDGDGYVVTAHEHHGRGYPLWYLDLIADPRATVETGRRTFSASAELLNEPARSQCLTRLQLQPRPGRMAALIRFAAPEP